jgi:hypothetical protein
MGELRLLDLFDVLIRHRVDFVIVGGVAASLLGSPLSTQDLDLLYDPAEDNLRRLLSALEELEAHYFDPAGRHLVPDISRLETLKVHLLVTKFGRLDLLRDVGADLTYGDLFGKTDTYEIRGSRVQALNLETLIRIKELVDRPKDRFALTYLRQLLKMRNLGEEP